MQKSKESKNNAPNEIISIKLLQDKIYSIRGQKVMLDYDLAKIYGYTTSAFNQQVSRNISKFEGEDFMFQLSRFEVDAFVKSQNVISRNLDFFSGQSGGARKLPYAFTEQGIYMLMTVLRGQLAVRQSRALIRMFKMMKDYIINNQDRLNYRSNLELALRIQDNIKDIELIKSELDILNQETRRIGNELNNAVKKSDISPILLDFNKVKEQREFIFLDGEPARANDFFVDLYSKANYSIHIIDNYVSIKTLRHLQSVNTGVKIIIYSDNLGNHLHKMDYDDFLRERPHLKIRFVRTEKKVHDRFIIIDINTDNEMIYHSGGSTKDVGYKITGLGVFTSDLMRDVTRKIIKDLDNNGMLLLK